MTAQNTASIEELQQKAQAGDAQAQFDLALSYANGDGVEKDEVLAFEWNKRAAELGHVEAQFVLGLIYFTDPFKRISDIKPEAEILFDASISIKVRKIKPTFVRNWPIAQEFDPNTKNFDLAILLATDLTPSEKFEVTQSTYDLAFVWLNRAAEENHAGAIYWRGVCYSKGYGTQQSDEIAFENIKRSAEVGYPYAYYSLALCYHEGKGCQQNYALAFKWIMKSVDDIYFKFHFGSTGTFAGWHAKSYLFLGKLYAEGQGTEQNNEQAFECFAKAAENRVAEAQFHLGRCYEFGLGVEEDFSLAIENYEAAFEGGFSDADTQYRIAKEFIYSALGDREKLHSGFSYLIQACRNNSKQALMWLEETCALLVFPYVTDRKDKKECYEFAADFINKMIATYPMDYEANFALGVMSAFGIGMEKNKITAINQFEKVYNSNEVDIPPELSGGDFHIIDAFAQLLKEIYKPEDEIFGVMNEYGLAIAFTQQKFIQGNENKNIVVLPALRYALHIHFGEYDQARDFFKSLSDMKTEFEYSGAKNAFEMMGLIGVGEIEKKNLELQEKNRELEETMAMFAHKFRSPLDAIIYNTEHEHQEKLYKQAAQTMRGLLDIFSMIATDSETLVPKIQQDSYGSGRLATVLERTLDMILLHLLSAPAAAKIQQHYLCYAKTHDLCDTELSDRIWKEEYFELERQLQLEWEQSYAQLLADSVTLEQRLDWLEQRFFKLEVHGFERSDIQFKEYGDTESLLTIVLNEVLVNAFKYYGSPTRQSVVLEWLDRDRYQILRCQNPSQRNERNKLKGSRKGHVFLSSLARKTTSEFSKPKAQDEFVLEFGFMSELLISS